MNSEVKEILISLDGVPWKIYLCTTDESALKIYADHGIHDQEVMKFCYQLYENDHVIIARCSTIDKEDFSLVSDTAYSVGFNPSYSTFEKLLRQFN